jgi:hypothetical protein
MDTKVWWAYCQDCDEKSRARYTEREARQDGVLHRFLNKDHRVVINRVPPRPGQGE